MDERPAIDGAALRQAALKGGEEARNAFEVLWLAYFRRLSAFAATYRGLPDAEREDAVAEALVAAFVGLASYDHRQPLSAWVYAVARHRFSDAARRSRRRKPYEWAMPEEELEAGHEPRGNHVEEIIRPVGSRGLWPWRPIRRIRRYHAETSLAAYVDRHGRDHRLCHRLVRRGLGLP